MLEVVRLALRGPSQGVCCYSARVGVLYQDRQGLVVFHIQGVDNNYT